MKPLTKLPAPFISHAGVIQNLVELATNEGFRGVSVIDSEAGSRRSSHWHRTDEHYLFVLSGSMLYTERKRGSGTVVSFTVNQGEMVHTGPMIEHWTSFPEDTRLISISKLSREHEEHERDLVRVDWLDEDPT
jgi:quercetin dioxygenase-like cupin family protein